MFDEILVLQENQSLILVVDLSDQIYVCTYF